MVNICGRDAYSVNEILEVCKQNPDQMRMTYKVRYAFGGPYDHDPYHGAGLERPLAMKGNDPHAIYPWEQLLTAAVQCAGSDYPMLADFFGIPLDGVAIELEATFDPRGEFAGLGGFPSIPEAPNCYLGFTWRATLVSDAPKKTLEKIHQRVLSHNMVLNALHAVPLKAELKVELPTVATA